MNKTCPCSNPPGGEITCRDDQLAICGVIEGEIVSGCFDQPLRTRLMISPVKRRTAVENWVLSMLTRAERSQLQEITSEEREILQLQSYTTSDGKTSVQFSLPRELEANSGTAAAAGA